MAFQPERANLFPEGSRVAFITGSARGIGEAIATRFAEDGLDIVINDIPAQKKDAERVAKKISDMGRRSMVTLGDVTNRQDVDNSIQEIIKEFGRLDVVVANAGIAGKPTKLVDCTPEQFEQVFDINVKGVFNTISAGAKVMIDQGWGGRILAAASVGAYKPGESMVPYCSSKYAVRGLIQGASQEWAKYGIRVNAYAPGYVDSVMLNGIIKGMGEINGKDTTSLTKHFENAIPLGRMVKYEDIAKAASFLISKDSEYITGQTQIIDGGVFFS